jgi:hypothetical protein
VRKAVLSVHPGLSWHCGGATAMQLLLNARLCQECGATCCTHMPHLLAQDLMHLRNVVCLFVGGAQV